MNIITIQFHEIIMNVRKYNENNYCDTELALSMNPKVINSINKGISQVITECANTIQIHFLTTPKHIVIG